MTDKPLTYSKHIIEIADILFANPTKEVSVIVSDIVSDCQKSERTIWRWVKKAQEYNQTRLNKQEKAKDKILVTSAKESIKKDILTREQAEEILTAIAKGGARKVIIETKLNEKGEEKPSKWSLQMPSDRERVMAIDRLSQMKGWDKPKKTANTDSEGNDIQSKLTDEQINKLIDKL
jgi:hypothetical protein